MPGRSHGFLRFAVLLQDKPRGGSMIKSISTFLSSLFVLMTTLATAGPTLNWKQGKQLTLAKGGYASGILNGKLLLAGGTHWKDDKKTWTDEVVAYDPDRDQWKPLPSLPKALAYAASAVDEEAFYVLGGVGPTRSERTGYRLNRQGGGFRWEEFTQLPVDRSYSKAVVLDGQLFLVGGSESVDDLSKASRALFSLSLKRSNTTWKTLREMPGEGRAVFAAASCDGKLYVFGGCLADRGGVRNLVSAFRYTPGADHWTRLRDVPIPTRAWSASSADGRFIFLFGGYSSPAQAAAAAPGGQFERRVYRYDTRLDTYEEMSPLPFPNADMSFHFWRGAFYGAGGEPLQKARAAWTFIGQLQEKPR
jgi:N-acetylneuraminic acid mutarotase